MYGFPLIEGLTWDLFPGGSVGTLLPNITFSFCPPLSCVLRMCYCFSGMSRVMCLCRRCTGVGGYCLRSQFKQQIVEDGTGWTLTELCDILLDILVLDGAM